MGGSRKTIAISDGCDAGWRAAHRLRMLAAGVFALLLASEAQAGIGDSWARFERRLAIFDPGGRYITRPIERHIPRLSVNGTYYLWGDTLVSGADNQGFRERDYRQLQFQNLFELELMYTFSENLQLTSVTHAMYDATYSIEGADGLYAHKADERFRLYESSKDVIREAFLSFRTLNLDLVVGKQQIAWGKMDGRFIDVINAIDNRESVQLEAADYELRRIPVWMANVTYYTGPLSLNVLWIPDFEPNENPTYGSPWFTPLLPPTDDVARHDDELLDGSINFAGDTVRRNKDRPDWTAFKDHQAAVRMDVEMGALTWGLIYFYAWNKNATDQIVGVEPSGTNLILSRRYKRVHHFGLTADYSATMTGIPALGQLPVVLRLEALYTMDVPFVDFRERQQALGGASVNGYEKHDTLRAAVAFEFALPQNATLIVQPSVFYSKGYKSSLGPGFGGPVGDEWAIIPVVFASRPFRFTRDRLSTSITVSPYISGPHRDFQGVKTRLLVSYDFSQYIEGSLIYTDYSGGAKNDLYGQYKHYDNIGFELQYEF